MCPWRSFRPRRHQDLGVSVVVSLHAHTHTHTPENTHTQKNTHTHSQSHTQKHTCIRANIHTHAHCYKEKDQVEGGEGPWLSRHAKPARATRMDLVVRSSDSVHVPPPQRCRRGGLQDLQVRQGLPGCVRRWDTARRSRFLRPDDPRHARGVHQVRHHAPVHKRIG